MGMCNAFDKWDGEIDFFLVFGESVGLVIKVEL